MKIGLSSFRVRVCRVAGVSVTLALIATGLGLEALPASAHGTSTPVASRLTERVSVSGGGGRSMMSVMPAISGDGTVVGFVSASPLVKGDTNNESDIYVRDLSEGMTERVSIGLDGDDPNAMSYFPSLSADGRYVAFASMASNLVAGDTNDMADVFIYDRVTNRTERVSVSSAGEQSEDGGFEVLGPSISADGRHVSFVSHASNLVPGDTNNLEDVFVHDRQTGRTRRVSVDSTGAESDGPSGFHAISGEGSVVTFVSAASNLVDDDTNGYPDVFAHDLDAGTTIRVSRGLAGAETNGPSETPSISSDGRTVAFTSAASNLVPDDTNGYPDTFAVDLQTHVIDRVSVDSDGVEADGRSFGFDSDFAIGPRLSGDGRLVIFVAEAWREDVSQEVGVFLHDRGSGATERVSIFDDPEGMSDALCKRLIG